MSAVTQATCPQIRSSLRARLAHLLAQPDARFAVYVLSIALIALGAFWRLIDLRYPNAFTFDEHHFVLNARNYIAHQADWNDHPPLGKLLLVPGMLLLGDNGLGWRISSALLGLALVAVAAGNARLLFGSRTVALLTAAFVAADGFFISYARTALLDTPLTLFMYLALYCMLRGSNLAWFAGAGISVGLAVATKWTGVCIFLLAPLLLWRARRSMLHAAWMLGLACGVYVVVWATAGALTHRSFSWLGLFSTTGDLLKHHAGFTAWDNAASSRWYTWPFLVHPIVLHHERIGDVAVRATTCLGNPLLWYGTTAAVLVAAFYVLRSGRSAWNSFSAPAAGEPRIPAAGVAIALAAMVALQLPFMLTQRQSYIWHYLGAYGIGIGLLAWGLAKLSARRPAWVLGFLVAAACLSVLYAPLWTNAVVPPEAYGWRLPFRSWR